jgi:hypothetical protein
VNARQNDPHAETAILPRDELAVRRQHKREGRLTREQLQRLLVAAELRKRSNQDEQP